jgi:hypothetical protein
MFWCRVLVGVWGFLVCRLLVVWRGWIGCAAGSADLVVADRYGSVVASNTESSESDELFIYEPDGFVNDICNAVTAKEIIAAFLHNKDGDVELFLDECWEDGPGENPDYVHFAELADKILRALHARGLMNPEIITDEALTGDF